MGILDRLLGRVTPERFAEMMADALRAAGVEGPIEFDAEQFLLRFGESHQVFLGNIWDEFQQAPKNMRQPIIEHFAWGMVSEAEMPESFEAARDQLMPVVKTRFYREGMVLRMQIEGEASVESIFPGRVFAGHFIITPAIDLPNRVMYLAEEQLSEWGVTLDEVLEVALANLAAPGLSVAGAEGHAYLAATEDVYNGSRVLLTDKIRQLVVQGRHVAAVPNRNTLVITGSDDEQGLEMLVGMIEHAAGQPRFESGVALVLGEDGWEPFMPPEDSPHCGAFRKQRLWSFGRDYAEQQELLNKLHEQQGTDIFVASFSVYEDRDTGALWSMGVWSEGVDTLLPRTESIAFARGDERKPEILGVAPWERVAEVAGALIEPTDYYPERWRVRQFPTQEQLDAMALDMGPFA